jgi:methylmalonyl-CoA mutase C-terminal domain/subunit
MNGRPLRILVAKAGLDGHDRGAKVVARALGEAGLDVVYLGLHRTAEEIAEAAVQAGADAVGLSIMSGAHLTLFPAVLEALVARGAADVVVFGGGIIPAEDAGALRALGVAELFGPGTSTEAIVAWVHAHVRARREARSERPRPAALAASGS